MRKIVLFYEAQQHNSTNYKVRTPTFYKWQNFDVVQYADYAKSTAHIRFQPLEKELENKFETQE